MRNTIVLPLNSIEQFDMGTIGTPLTTPSNFNAISGDTKLNLSWSSVLNALGYRIFYDTSTITDIHAGSVTRINITDGEQEDYELTGLTNGITYYFRIVTVSPPGYSSPSSEITGVPSTYINTYSTTFDGINETINCGANASLKFDNTDKYSYVLWIKSLGNAGSTEDIMGNINPAVNNQGQYLYRTSTEYYRLSILSSTATSEYLTVEIPTVMTSDLWRHIVFTYSGSSLASGVNAYVNGIKQTLTVVTDTLTGTTLNSTDFRLGSRNGSSAYLNAKIDEIGVYNEELSQAEVTEIYNSGVPFDLRNATSVDDMVSYWRAGDGDTATTLYDNKGINNGTLVNMDASNYTTDVP